ncbi:hypothetical protein CNMCM8927_004100 [Aspergillus lentulus]|uniref:Uncharacterized protein n=1 Tax=Aspergillus lentulus TaxID=293939 RepID=A0AAN5YT50_ASPLE|nr:hypothetical protein CNMCM8927_004100 [Aspergillus lentulus]
MSAYTTPIPLSGRGPTAKLVRQTGIPKSSKDDETKAIDIVAVHGLNPWESHTGRSFWLRDFIAKDIRGARVFTFDYDVKAVWLCEAPLEGIQGATRALLAQIAAIREEVPSKRPLVLICHGFGGFIVESCLNDAFTHFPTIFDCILGVIFLSTPQRTSPEVPWATLLKRCASDGLPLGWSQVELSSLGDLSWAESSVVALRDISEGFKAKAKATKKMKLLFCYEDVPTPPQQECSLNEYCAALGLRREKVELMVGCSHLSMASFLSRKDENYQRIISVIKKIRNSALKDTEPTSTLELSKSGRHKNVQEIQNHRDIEESQALNVHALSTLVVGQRNDSFQNTVTISHNTLKITPLSPVPMHASGARELSHGTQPGTMITLTQPAPAYGCTQDASRSSIPTCPTTPQLTQFGPSLMKIPRRPVGLPASKPMFVPHSASGQLGQEIQHSQYPLTNLAPITAPEPNSSAKSGKEPRKAHEAGPLGPAKPASSPGNAAPKLPVVHHLVGDKVTLSASPNSYRPQEKMHYPTAHGIPIGSSQHIAPQPSSTTYQYPPISHPLPTNHPMAHTTAAMPVQTKPPKKVAKPPKLHSDAPTTKPPKLPGMKSVSQQNLPQMIEPGIRPPPVLTTAGGRTIPKIQPALCSTAAQQSLRELQLQPSFTPPPKKPGIFRRLLSAGKVSQPAPTPTGSRVPSGLQVGLHQPHNTSNSPFRPPSLGASEVLPGSQGGAYQQSKPTKPPKPSKPSKPSKPVSMPSPGLTRLRGPGGHPGSQGGQYQQYKPPKPSRPTSLGVHGMYSGSQSVPYQPYKPPPKACLPPYGPLRPAQGPPMHGHSPHGHSGPGQHQQWDHGNQWGQDHGFYNGPDQTPSNITGNGLMMPILPVGPIILAEPTVPIEPTVPVEPTVAVETTVSIETAVSVEPIIPAEPTGPVKPVEPAEPTVPVEPTAPGAASILAAPGPVKPTGSSVPTGTAGATGLIEVTSPVKPADPVEPTGPPTGPLEATGLFTPTNPVQPAGPVKPIGPFEHTGPHEPTGGSFTCDGNPGQPWKPGYSHDLGHHPEGQNSQSGNIASGLTGLAIGAASAAILMSSTNHQEEEDESAQYTDQEDEDEGEEDTDQEEEDESAEDTDQEEEDEIAEDTDQEEEDEIAEDTDQEEEDESEEDTNQEEDEIEEDTDQEEGEIEEDTDQEEEDESEEASDQEEDAYSYDGDGDEYDS